MPRRGALDLGEFTGKEGILRKFGDELFKLNAG